MRKNRKHHADGQYGNRDLLFSYSAKVWAAEGDSPSAVSSTITTTDEHGRKIYTNDSEPAQSPSGAGSAAEARDAGVLEQQGKSLEAGALRGYGLDAGGAVGGGGSQRVFRARVGAVGQCENHRGQLRADIRLRRTRLTRPS